MFVFENESQIANLYPDIPFIARLNARGVIVTAKGNSVDFVSRFFAPQSGINEDPVTGSAHTTLTPYWSGKLGRNDLSAIQLSSRKGYLQCKHLGDRVRSGIRRERIWWERSGSRNQVKAQGTAAVATTGQFLAVPNPVRPSARGFVLQLSFLSAIM